ncbi:MAG: hypothetical protein [Wendovervirus sonii]|uniref:Uncharacterized protein n=1 Tax=phage Lak_Megaphage_Sonny TaxID=3109229 RepID=A0ABZ0Z2K7_9CAUD|nr:MAG: hypothetical protein [phage Lak_Megaphage_Sonny]
MKIRLNNNINEQIKILNEAQPAPMDMKQQFANQTDDDKMANVDRFNEAYEYQCKQQFMYSRRKDSLMINLKMPSDIAGPLRVKRAPEDLANLMRELEVNGKFLNIHNMVEDPQKTFNHASDYAFNSFANLGELEVSKNETQKNTANIFKGESYYYNGIYNQLNENDKAAAVAGITGATIGGAAIANAVAGPGKGLLGRLAEWNLFNQAGSHAGWVSGKIAGNIANGGLQACIHFVGAAGIQLAASMGALWAVGYGLGTLFGQADALKGANNNKEEQDSNLETKDTTRIEPDDEKYAMLWHGDNALEAINDYITNVTESVGNLVAQISSKPDKYNEFAKEINKYINAEDQSLATFFKMHNDIENAVQDQIRKELENRQRLKDMHNEEKANFATELSKLLKTANSEDVRKYYEAIQDHYMRHCTTSTVSKNAEIRNLYQEAIEKGRFQDVLDVYLTHKNESYNSNEIEYSEDTILNEADGETIIKKPEVDVTAIYKAISQKVKEFMIDMFPMGDGKNIPGMQDIEQQMNARIEGASAAIKESIEQVCSVFNKGQDAKLGDKLKQFFLSHPLQASRLKELWTAHETELKMRKNRRLKQMQDYGNVERTIGWSANFCKTVLPDLYGRLFAYRYILSILKQNGYYNYTPELYKADEEEWESQKNDYISKAESETEWILATYGNDYTQGDKPFLTYSDNGVEVQNPMSYASLLLMKYKNPNFESMDDDEFEKFITTTHKIAGNNSDDKVLDTINYIKEALEIQGYNNDILEKVEDFRISEQYRNVKDDIFKAYKNITSLQTKMNSTNQTACWNLLSANPTIFKNYKNNYDAIQKIIQDNTADINQLLSDYSGNKNEGLAQKAKELEKKIHDILGEYVYNPSEIKQSLDFSKMIKLAENNNNVDYYAYILSFYKPLLKASKISDITINNEADTIKAICDDTYKAIELINSGILAIGHIMTENDSQLNIIQQALKMYVKEPDNNEKIPTLKDIYVYMGGTVDNFDKAYNVIDESLKNKLQKEKNGKEPDNAPDLIYNRIIAQLENPQDAINSTDMVKQNIKNLFYHDEKVLSFDNLKIKDYVKQAKNVTSLKGFAEIEETCTFADDKQNQDDQNSFIGKLKSEIRHIIEYVLASTYSEDATRSVKFNIIIKDLHKIIAAVSKDEKNIDLNALYPAIKNAFVNANGDGNKLDTEYQKLYSNSDNVKKFAQKLIKLMQDPVEINNDLSKLIQDFKKYIKNCTESTLYGLAYNDKIKNVDDIKYILDESDDANINSFMTDFCGSIRELILNSMWVSNEDNLNINILKEKVIFGKTIPDYAKYIFDFINYLSDATYDTLNNFDSNNSDHVYLKNTVEIFEKIFENMNDEYLKLYKGTFTNKTDYNSISDSGQINISIKAFKKMSVFEGLFDILNSFKDINLDKINKIDDIFNNFNSIKFESGTQFINLSNDDKKDVLLHIIEAFKLSNLNDSFKNFNETLHLFNAKK